MLSVYSRHEVFSSFLKGRHLPGITSVELTRKEFNYPVVFGLNSQLSLCVSGLQQWDKCTHYSGNLNSCAFSLGVLRLFKLLLSFSCSMQLKMSHCITLRVCYEFLSKIEPMQMQIQLKAIMWKVSQ